MPFVVRLDGTNDEEGRRLLAEANLPNVHAEATMLAPARASSPGGLAEHEHPRRQPTPSCAPPGITGREGTFHTLQQSQATAPNVVAGVTPGKGGQDVDGIPVFDTFHEAVAETGANTAMIFVPPRFAADSILEADDAGIELVVCITEGIPAHDELRVYDHLQPRHDAPDRPQLPGRALPRQGQRRASSPPPSSRRATSAWSRARAR